MKNKLRIAIVAALLMPASAQAQADDPALLRAYAAGYKAQFVCSAHFAGGKNFDQIERDELSGIYPEIAEIMPTLTAEVNESGRRVSVSFDDDMPPRFSEFNDWTGCRAAPIGKTIPVVCLDCAPPPARTAPGALDKQPWPMGDADAEGPRHRGLTPIEQVTMGAATGEYGGKTSAALVVRMGKIVAENYALGHDKHTGQRTWSVAKSIAGSYAGYVQQLTDMPVDLPAYEGDIRGFGPGDPRGEITIDNLLRMASGRHSDTPGNRTDHVYMGGGQVEKWATPWPLLHKPGSRFRYANNDILLAVMAMQGVAKKAGGNIHPHHLFDKLGMTRTFAETDWNGDYILSSQVWTTARDLARLGLLYLKNGEWNGEQLLPENWRAYVSTPSGPQPEGKFGYGATFWLMNQSDGIPKDTFAAFGNRGQYLVIIPSLDMIIVRRGYDSDGNRFNVEAFTRAIVAAIK